MQRSSVGRMTDEMAWSSGRSTSVGSPGQASCIKWASRCAWLHPHRPAASGISLRARSTLPAYPGRRFSLVAAPLPLPRPSLPAWPPRYSLTDLHRPAQSRLVSGSDCLYSLHPRSWCFQHFRMQDPARRLEPWQRPFASIVHRHWSEMRRRIVRNRRPAMSPSIWVRRVQVDAFGACRS
jgi:hypothetical protein